MCQIHIQHENINIVFIAVATLIDGLLSYCAGRQRLRRRHNHRLTLTVSSNLDNFVEIAMRQRIASTP